MPSQNQTVYKQLPEADKKRVHADELRTYVIAGIEHRERLPTFNRYNVGDSGDDNEAATRRDAQWRSKILRDCLPYWAR